MKNSFILFQNYREYFEDLTGDEAKELLFAIFDYEKTRVKPSNLSTKVGCYFLVIKQQLDKQYQEYINIANKNRENINKRWNKEKQKDTKNTNGINGKKAIPNILDIDNDIVIDNDNKKEINKEKSVPKALPTKFVKPSKQELRDFALQEHLTANIIDEFFDYYDSNGWKVGRNPMKDWKATYRRWCRNQPETKEQLQEKERQRKEEETMRRVLENVKKRREEEQKWNIQ